MSEKIKIDRALAPRKTVRVKAIAVYPRLLGRQIISSVERAEVPEIHVYLNWNERRRSPELALVFTGNHRLEDLTYFKKNPERWIGWGRVTLSEEQAADLARTIDALVKWRRKAPVSSDQILRLEQQLLDFGVNADQVIREEEAKKIAGMRIAYKFGAKPRPRTYEFTFKEKIEILQEKLKELKEQHSSRHTQCS